MNTAVANWMLGRDTGLSSMAIVAFMEGARSGPFHYPCDPSDLGRCLRLLEIAPEYNERLFEMALVGPEWAGLVRHWEMLAGRYRFEQDTGAARECYRMMQTVIALGDKGELRCPHCDTVVGPPRWRAYAYRTYAKWEPKHVEERLQVHCDHCGHDSKIQWIDGRWVS